MNKGFRCFVLVFAFAKEGESFVDKIFVKSSNLKKNDNKMWNMTKVDIILH